MKYKLINKQTKEEHLCEKVTTDGFDYYVSDAYGKPAIATNNPNIDIPKVVDEIEIKVDEILNKELPNFTPYHRRSFFLGYDKSQETHPFSEEDMIEFGDWVRNNPYIWNYPDKFNDKRTTKELFQLWKEQKLKTLYYA